MFFVSLSGSDPRHQLDAVAIVGRLKDLTLRRRGKMSFPPPWTPGKKLSLSFRSASFVLLFLLLLGWILPSLTLAPSSPPQPRRTAHRRHSSQPPLPNDPSVSKTLNPPNSHFRTSSIPAPADETFAKSAIRRISEKLRSLGYLADDPTKSDEPGDGPRPALVPRARSSSPPLASSTSAPSATPSIRVPSSTRSPSSDQAPPSLGSMICGAGRRRKRKTRRRKRC